MSAETLSIIILLGSFLIMILLRFPIAYAVGLSALLCLLSMGESPTTLGKQMVTGISPPSASWPCRFSSPWAC